MSSIYTPQVLSSLSTLTLYRLLIKNMKFYPSKKRFELLLSIREEFRTNRGLPEDDRRTYIERKKVREKFFMGEILNFELLVRGERLTVVFFLWPF